MGPYQFVNEVITPLIAVTTTVTELTRPFIGVGTPFISIGMFQEVRINGLFHLLINGIYWGYNLLILTFLPALPGTSK